MAWSFTVSPSLAHTFALRYWAFGTFQQSPCLQQAPYPRVVDFRDLLHNLHWNLLEERFRLAHCKLLQLHLNSSRGETLRVRSFGNRAPCLHAEVAEGVREINRPPW